MLAYIKGVVTLIKNEFAVIETGGVGFKLIMPLSDISALKQGSEATVFTHLYVREDIMDLYGFASEESLKCFNLLISISGVGPKAAIAVLSSLNPQQLSIAVNSGDDKAIKQAQGIGAKIAQRIVLELKGKLAPASIEEDDDFSVSSADTNDIEQAAMALVSLGYSPQQARDAAAKSGGSNVEEIIKNALKRLI